MNRKQETEESEIAVLWLIHAQRKINKGMNE